MNYQEGLSTEFLCRVCLTRSKKMISLTATLNDKKNDSAQILEALEKVMSVKITCDNPFPTVICPMCLGLLKISYNLKIQFEISQNTLREHFKDTLVTSTSDGEKIGDEANYENVSSDLSPVEIIIGPNKYDLKDIVIVEEEKEDQEEYRGFLDNLGKTVTAKFINKNLVNRRIVSKEEEPVVLIEKIEEKVSVQDDMQDACDDYDDVQKLTENSTLEHMERLIIVQDDDVPDHTNVLKVDNLNLEEFGLQNPTDADQELFQSALNMQLKCTICDKLYSSRGRLKRHLEKCRKVEYQIVEDEKGDPSIASIPTLLGCHLCSRIFKEKKFLTYHIKMDHSLEPLKFTCDVCGHEARNRNAYVYHKLTRHGERKYICDICGKKFFTSSTLKTHTLNHKQSTQCVCPVCGKTFHYKGGLFYHMKQHTNERKYCCEFCDRKFYTLMALKRHTLTHTGVRPYACKFCEKKFFSTGEVRKHEYLHTGHRPFRCQYCKKGFASSYNLKVHLVTHPGSFSCELCDRAFVNGSVLRFHSRTKHGITE